MLLTIPPLGVMAKTTDKHVLADDIYIYKSANSSRWTARFKVGTQWVAKSTKEKTIKAATVRAIELRVECQTKVDNNLPIFTGVKSSANTFRSIAKKAIKRMDAATANGTGKVIFSDYILVLNRYHIPYFDNINIKDIDAQMLLDFDSFRTKLLGRVPAKSTISNHNAALQRVFDEAVVGKHITALELPEQKNTGRTKERRAAFSHDEYQTVLAESKNWIELARKQVSKDIRTLLYFYIQFAVMTGMRPGKEIEQLTWSDVHDLKIKGKSYTAITVRKGKTTESTGTREVICNHAVTDVLEGMKATLKKSEADDLIFSMPNGKRSTQIGKNFTQLLENTGLKNSTYGERTLYSLRHTYITWQLQNKMSLTVIAAQCGTSVKMIEEHYSHVVPSMFAEELSGTGAILELTSLSEVDILNTVMDDGGKILAIKNGIVTQE